jgi:hypothetical protein
MPLLGACIQGSPALESRSDRIEHAFLAADQIARVGLPGLDWQRHQVADPSRPGERTASPQCGALRWLDYLFFCVYVDTLQRTFRARPD